MAELAPDLYSNSFIADRPKAAQTLLTSRLRHAELISTSLSSYFAERSSIEQEYAKRLQKLAQKDIVPSSYGALRDDAGFDKVYSSLQVELAEIIRIHEGFARKLDQEVSNALRDGGKLGESAANNASQDVAGPIREYEDAFTRHQKGQSGGGSSLLGKKTQVPANTGEDLTTSHAIWSAAAPTYLSAMQRIEKQRWQSIKENLAKYTTLQSDVGRDILGIAEKGLLTAVSWEPDDDMQTFSLKEGGKTAPGANPSQAIAAPSAHRRAPPPVANGRKAPPPPPSRQQAAPEVAVHSPSNNNIIEPSPSIRSGISSHAKEKDSPSKGGFLSAISSKIKPGLKRNRSSSKPDAYGVIKDNGPVGGRNTQSRPSIDDRYSLNEESGLTGAAASQGSDRRDVSPSPELGGRSKRDSFMPSIMRRKNSIARSSSSVGRDSTPTMTQAQYPPTVSTSFIGETLEEQPNGAALETPTEELALPTIQPSKPSVVAPLASSGSLTSNNPFTSLRSQPINEVAADGYSVPPAGYDAQPFQNNASRSLFDDDEPAPSKLNMTIQQPGVSQETPDEQRAAFSKVQNTLLSASGSSSNNVNRRATARGRRSTYQPAGDEPISSSFTESPSSTSPMSTFLPNASPSLSRAQSPPAIIPGRAGSILSNSSSIDNLQLANANPFENPNGPGLRAAIIESINVLAKAGQPAKVVISGEVLLQLRHLPAAGTVSIKLNAYGDITKPAPDQQYLTALDHGEFQVETARLSSSTSSSPAVVLKYQINVTDAAEYVPIVVKPMWRCEPTQTSVLVTYSANSNCRLANASLSAGSPFENESTALLKDVSFAIPIAAAGVSNIQSKPAANYEPDRKRLLWPIPDISMDNGASQKALARFAVESESQTGPVAVKWRLPGRLASGISIEIARTSGDITHFAEVVLLTQAGKHLVA